MSRDPFLRVDQQQHHVRFEVAEPVVRRTEVAHQWRRSALAEVGNSKRLADLTWQVVRSVCGPPGRCWTNPDDALLLELEGLLVAGCLAVAGIVLEPVVEAVISDEPLPEQGGGPGIVRKTARWVPPAREPSSYTNVAAEDEDIDDEMGGTAA